MQVTLEHYRRWLLVVWVGCAMLLSGCWDSHDINLRAMPVIMGVAKGQSHRYEVTLQIPIPVEKNISMKIVSQEADTISEAVDNLKINIENYVDLLNVEMLVVHQTLAEGGLEDELDYAIRSRDLSPKALLAITDGDIKQLLTNTKNAVTSDVTTFFKYSDRRAGWNPKTSMTSIWEAFISTKSYTKDIILPMIRPGKETVLSIDGSAVLRQGKMITKINKEDTLIVNMELNNYHGAAVEVLDNANMILESASMHWTPKITKDGPALEGKLKLHTSLSETRVKTTKEALTTKLKSHITDHLNQLTKKLQQSGGDPLGLGNYFRGKLPYDQLEHWRNDYYPNLTVTYQVEVVLDNIGNLELEE